MLPVDQKKPVLSQSAERFVMKKLVFPLPAGARVQRLVAGSRRGMSVPWLPGMSSDSVLQGSDLTLTRIRTDVHI